jgi:hypothetical protein
MKCCHNTRRLRSAGGGLSLALLLAVLLSGCGGATGLAVTLTPSANQAVDEAQSVSFTAFVPGDTSNSGVSWSLSGAHCKGAACGTFVNSTPFATTYVAPKTIGNGQLLTVTLTATSIAENSAYTTLNIVVSPAPVIATTSPLPGALNGSDYNEQIIANGGVAPLVFTITSGSVPPGCTPGLPPGLNLNTNGYVTGRTTSDGGTYCFTVTVTDQGSPPLVVSQAYTLTVTPAPPLSVATTSPLPNAALGTAYSLALAANGGVPPLTWAITSGALPPGLSLAGMTGQISGTPTSEGTFSFTAQVTDSSLLQPGDHSQTATESLNLTVGPPNPLSIVTSTLPQAQTASLYSQTIVVTGGVGPYTWTLTSGILPSGISLNSAGTLSGIATAVSANTFTVQVSDSESPPVSKSATLTLQVIAAIDNNELLSGDYIFVFSGYNPSGPVVLGGGFVADGNGNVSGAIDSNNNDGPGTTNNNGPGPTEGNAMTGTYTTSSNGQGTLSMTVNSITYVYAFALDGEGNGQLVEADNLSPNPATRGTGILRKQPTPLPNYVAADFDGSYVFQVAGTDSGGKRAAYAGVFQANGAGLLNNGIADSNDAGNVGTGGVSGSFTIPAQNGRGEASISIPSGASLNFIYYMISPSDILLVGIDPLSSTNPMTTGEAILQTQSSFSASSMNGSSVVTTTGQDTSGKSSVLLGLLSANGANGVSATVNGNDGGSISTTSVSGSYSVASNGRVSTSGLGSQLAVMYLISPNYGFVIGQDSAASSGLAEAQSAGPFTAGSFDSYFTFGPPLMGSPGTGSASTNDFVGSLVSDGVSTVSGKITETASANDLVISNSSMQGTYTVSSNGGGVISFSSPSQLPSQFVFYMLSPTAIRAISAVSSDTQPTLFFLNH